MSDGVRRRQLHHGPNVTLVCRRAPEKDWAGNGMLAEARTQICEYFATSITLCIFWHASSSRTRTTGCAVMDIRLFFVKRIREMFSSSTLKGLPAFLCRFIITGLVKYEASCDYDIAYSVRGSTSASSPGKGLCLFRCPTISFSGCTSEKNWVHLHDRQVWLSFVLRFGDCHDTGEDTRVAGAPCHINRQLCHSPFHFLVPERFRVAVTEPSVEFILMHGQNGLLDGTIATCHCRFQCSSTCSMEKETTYIFYFKLCSGLWPPRLNLACKKVKTLEVDVFHQKYSCLQQPEL